MIIYKYKEKTENKINNISIKGSTMEKNAPKGIIESFEHFGPFCSAKKRYIFFILLLQNFDTNIIII